MLFCFSFRFCFVWFLVALFKSAASVLRPRLWLGLAFRSFVLAAVCGKCYLTASVTLHNCSHFLDCVAALNLLLFCLSCRISGARADGVRGHYDYLERITKKRRSSRKTQMEGESQIERKTQIYRARPRARTRIRIREF